MKGRDTDSKSKLPSQPTPTRPPETRERLFEILQNSKYDEAMQSRLGRKEAAFLATVALAGCVDEEGVILESVSKPKLEKRGDEIDTKHYLNKKGQPVENREIPQRLIYADDDLGD